MKFLYSYNSHSVLYSFIVLLHYLFLARIDLNDGSDPTPLGHWEGGEYEEIVGISPKSRLGLYLGIVEIVGFALALNCCLLFC